MLERFPVEYNIKYSAYICGESKTLDCFPVEYNIKYSTYICTRSVCDIQLYTLLQIMIL